MAASRGTLPCADGQMRRTRTQTWHVTRHLIVLQLLCSLSSPNDMLHWYGLAGCT